MYDTTTRIASSLGEEAVEVLISAYWTRISAGINSKKLMLLERRKYILTERKSRFSHPLK